MTDYRAIVPASNQRFVTLSEDGPYDLYVQGVFAESFEGRMSFQLGETSSKVSGLITLSQQFLIVLLTTPGSDLFDPLRGTSFSSLIGGNFYDPAEVRIVVRESVATAEKYVRREQTRNPPSKLSERLVSAELLRIEQPAEDRVAPYILLRSAEGRFANVELPSINVFS
jgi:hypothetical protein